MTHPNIIKFSAQSKQPILEKMSALGPCTAPALAKALSLHEMTIRSHGRDLRVLGIIFTNPYRLTRLGVEIVAGKRSLYELLEANNRPRFESVGQED